MNPDRAYIRELELELQAARSEIWNLKQEVSEPLRPRVVEFVEAVANSRTKFAKDAKELRNVLQGEDPATPEAGAGVPAVAEDETAPSVSDRDR